MMGGSRVTRDRYDHILNLLLVAEEMSRIKTCRLLADKPLKGVLFPAQSTQIALFFDRVGIHHKVHPHR